MVSASPNTCARCGAALRGLAPLQPAGSRAEARPSASFCGECGARVVALAASLDAEPIAHLEVAARGLLRLRVECQGAPVDDVALTLTLDGQELASLATGPIAGGAAAVVTAAWTPTSAGFHALAGEVKSHDAAWCIEPVHLRVGTERQPVSITIDQSHARVVDNSRSTFGVGPSGGILGDGEWQPLALVALTRAAPAAIPERPVFAPVAFTVKTARATYDIDDTLARGDLATIFAARERASGQAVAVKLLDDPADNDLGQQEVDVLAELSRDPGRSPSPAAHLPVVLDRFKTADGRTGTVLERIDGIDLVEVRRRLAARGEPGLAPRHLVWLMRRCLGVLGWAHDRGIVHANLDPAHIMIRPRDHMAWVIDWCWAVVNPARTGQGFKAKNELYSPPEVAERKPPIPASDLYSLGKCIIFAAGGDPATKTLPARDDLDERLGRFIKWLVNDSARGRPQDALQLYLQLDRLREQIWGPHAFVPLDI
ncbi:MAG: hypothetical protein U1F43_20530 [Myxococcota bacterium]